MYMMKKLKNYLEFDIDNESLLNKQNQAKKIGIKGAPCFIFNKELVVSGVQTKENFMQIIESINSNV